MKHWANSEKKSYKEIVMQFRHLKTYPQILESKKESPHGEEFIKAVENSEYAPYLSEFFTFAPVKTGRIYVYSHYLPAKTMVEKTQNGERWMIWYSSAGRNYGHAYFQNIEDLLKHMIIDSVAKGYESNKDVLARKDFNEIIKDKEWVLDNLDLEDTRGIYPKMQQMVASKTGIITDFSDLKMPYLDFLNESGFSVVNRKSIDISGCGIYLSSRVHSASFEKIMDFFKPIGEIVNSLYPNDDLSIRAIRVKPVDIDPIGEGISVRKGSSRYVIEAGFKTEEEARPSIDNALRKIYKKNVAIFISLYTGTSNKDLDFLEKELSSIAGEMLALGGLPDSEERIKDLVSMRKKLLQYKGKVI